MPTVAELFPAYGEHVLGWLLRKTRNRQVAEDVASTAWLRALRAEQRGQVVEIAYVFGAAQSALVDLVRRQRPVSVGPLSEALDPAAPEPVADELRELSRLLREEYG